MSRLEFLDFKTFLKSSRAYNRAKLTALAEYILSNFENNKFERLTVKKIVKDRTIQFNFNNDIYEYIELFAELINDFIFFRRYENNDINKNLFLLNQHINLRNFKMLSGIDKKLKKTLFEEEQDYQLNYFKYLYSNEISLKRFKERKKKKLKEGELDISSHLFNFQSLSKYYFCEIVNIFTKFIRDENNFNISKESSEISDIKFTIENIYSRLPSDDLVKIYYYQYMCFKSPQTSNYIRYKSHLKKVEKKLSESELKLHYSNLLNYCLLTDNENKESEYNVKELLEFFKLFIVRKYYIDENNLKYLPPAYFRNTVILCERVKDVRFINDLINKFSTELDPKLRKDFINYASVFNHYLRNDNRASIKSSFKVPNTYTGFLIDTKRINILNYYTLEKFDSAEKEIHSLRELIRRQKTISLNVRKRFFAFCKYSERLILKKNVYNSLAYSRIRLAQEDWFPSKDWLLDKYSEQLERKAS